MGLKNKLSKMKNFLFDEEEEESVNIKKPKEKNRLKKDETKKNIIDKTAELSELNEDIYLEDISEEIHDTKTIKTRSSKSEFDFKFPEFDDKDFMVSNPIIKEQEEPKYEEPEKVKTNLYQGSRRKDEIKKFKPSPIISPIYGLLDKDGNMIEKDSLDYKRVTFEKDEVTFDDVRKKAYGKIDEELENTIKRLNKKTLEEAEKEHEESRKKEKITNTKKIKAVKEKIEDEDDDIILPNVNFKEIDVDNRKIISKSNGKDDEDEDDTKEQDLFNLIDTIYNRKETDK